MITGYNDWDALLDEVYYRGILEGRINLPPPQPIYTSLVDYGKGFTFTFSEFSEKI